MALFRNGMVDPDAENPPPFGIEQPSPPDPSVDTYHTTAPAVQQGWLGGGGIDRPQTTTTPASTPGPPKPSPYTTPASQDNQIRSAHQEQPPQPPDLSAADRIALGLSHRPGIAGVIASLLSGSVQKKVGDYQGQRQAYEDRQRNQEHQMAMRPRPPTAQESEDQDIQRISQIPEVAQVRSGGQPNFNRLRDDGTREPNTPAGPLGRAEYRTGVAAAKTDAELPNKLKQIQARADTKVPTETSRTIHTAANGSTFQYDPKAGIAYDMTGKQLPSIPPMANATAANNDPEGIEAAAQSLAKGELTSLQDLAGRGAGAKLKIFKRARELDPTFSTSNINRKIKMAADVTSSQPTSIGGQLQSFGTFLEHGGEAADALKTVSQGNIPALNKPLNYYKKNLAGDPNFQRFMVSLEPVRKEFEGFLLGGRALYGDDRKAAEVILNDNSSPAQIHAALNQMGKTAKDRFTEINHRYKRTMGKDIEDAFSPEAEAGAAKIGVQLRGGGAAAPAAAPAGKPQFQKMSSSGKFGWDGTKWVPVSQ